LAELIETNNDATLEELRYLLYGRIGFSLSTSTIGRMIKLLDITVKKNSLPFRLRHGASSNPAM
jgi:putative transposase